jgi:hypothetical protein
MLDNRIAGFSCAISRREDVDSQFDEHEWNQRNAPSYETEVSRFTNWVQEDFGTALASSTFTLTLQNQSAAGAIDWLALDWIELHLELAP